MRTVTTFETPEELLNALYKYHAKGDTTPTIPSSISLWIGRDGTISFTGEGSKNFSINGFKWRDVVEELLRSQNIKFHFATAQEEEG